MINKKSILIGMLFLLLPFLVLNPLSHSLFNIFQWDYIIIAIFYLSEIGKKIGVLYAVYAGLLFDTMVSPSLGFFLIYFLALFMGFYAIKKFLKLHSPISAFFSVLILKLLSIPFLYILSNLLLLELLPFRLSEYFFSSLGTSVLTCIIYYFIKKKYKEYSYER